MAKRARKSKRPGAAKRSREVKHGEVPASRARAAAGNRRRPRTRAAGSRKAVTMPVTVSSRKEFDRVEETLGAIHGTGRGRTDRTRGG
jgi:hypothetical protein